MTASPEEDDPLFESVPPPKPTRLEPRLKVTRSKPRPEAPDASDDAIAELFRLRHGDDWRFVPHWGRWLQWDGARWAKDEGAAHVDAMRLLCREVALGCVRERDGQRIASHKTIVAAERLARTDPALVVHARRVGPPADAAEHARWPCRPGHRSATPGRSVTADDADRRCDALGSLPALA